MSSPHTRVREVEGGFERRCYTCKTWKSQTLENFYPVRSDRGNRTHPFHPQCKICACEGRREYRKTNAVKQRAATKLVRTMTRERRWKVLDLLEDVQSFLNYLPLADTVDDLCVASRTLKQRVDLYVAGERPSVKRSKESLSSKIKGQKTKDF